MAAFGRSTCLTTPMRRASSSAAQMQVRRIGAEAGPLRITYLHQYFNNPSMPGGTRSYEFARRLVARGHEVTMITSDRHESRRSTAEERIDGIRVMWIPVKYSNAMSYRRRMVAFSQFALKSARIACACECDVIFATSTPLTIVFPAMLAAWWRRVPWVLEVRDLWPEIPIAVGAIRNPLARYATTKVAHHAYRSARSIVALSPGIRSGVMRYGIEGHKIAFIPNVCNIGHFQSPESHSGQWIRDHPDLAGRTIALYPGQIGTINGLEYVLDMARATRERMPSLAFVLLGGGSEYGRIESQARDMGLLGVNVFMYPYMSKAEVPLAFAAAAVILGIFRPVQGMESNSSNKFFDALAAGRPVAINYEGWHADLVRREGLGVVMPPDDPTAAAQQLADFLSDAAATQRAGRESLRVARRDFDLEALALQIEDVLNSAVTDGTGAPAGRQLGPS